MSPCEVVAEFDRHASCLARAGSRRCNYAVPAADLKQEALIGGLKANQSYSSSHGAQLATWIRNKMKYAVLDAIRAETKSRMRGGPPEFVSFADVIKGEKQRCYWQF